MSRVLVWFSCGVASAVSAKLTLDEYGDKVEVLYCDTLSDEHPDNARFLKECEQWLGVPIKLLKSTEYKDRWDVYEKTRYLVGPYGARCTTELKKKLRIQYQQPDDCHVMGYTIEETKRAKKFELRNPELTMYWPLIEKHLTKSDCLALIDRQGIAIPAMYLLGYRNNNCIGCPKGGVGYWSLVKKTHPEEFERMAKVERKLDIAICKTNVNGDRKRIFLDEITEGMGNYEKEPDIECGISCGIVDNDWKEQDND